MSMLDDFLNAMSSQESGGNYSSVNKNTGALGRWQVMPGNVTPWAKKYLGINMTAGQFIRTPALQDKLVKAVLGSYVSKYGYRGAASAWYSGQPSLENNYRPQRYGPSIGDYVDSVMGHMESKTGSLTQVASGLADMAVLSAAKVQRSLPNAKIDPLEVGQGIQLDEQGQQKEPSAVKGIGLSIEDGSGAGQEGIKSPYGLDSGSDLTEGAQTVEVSTDPPGKHTGGNEVFSTGSNDQIIGGLSDFLGSPEGAVAAAGGAGNPSGHYTYYNPVPGFKPSGTWNGRANIGIAGRHRALDFAAPYGTAVHAPLGGTVVLAGWDPNGASTNGGFGLSLRIHNDDGSYVILGHLSSIGNIKVGQRVEGNQVVGKVGNTGNSYGSHLHLEFRHAAFDPNSAFDFTSLFKW
jgi:murein DD-endopeptidase MepM/ murein hydrolase activator NlpD